MEGSYLKIDSKFFNKTSNLAYSYKIKATITSNEIEEMSVTAEIQVSSNIIQQYEYAYIPKVFANENEELLFHLLVQHLIPNCKAKWSVSGDNKEQISEISKVNVFS